MLATLGFEMLTPRAASVGLGLVLGLIFGLLAEPTRFCLRRGLAGAADERRPALALWLVALAAALAGTQAAVAAGLVDLSGHRLLAADLPWLAVALGGLMFGAGMVLTRGCASRLTVLAGTGNLRAGLVLVVMAITAHAAMKGVLAPLRLALTDPVLTLATPALPGGPAVWLALAVLAAGLALRGAGLGLRTIAAGGALGLLVPAAWVGTGWLLADDFDPIPVESLSMILPSADTLFWAIAASAVPAGFGSGLIGGIVAGALAASTLGGRFGWQSFGSAAETGRYLAGATLVGLGGVLAGGCTLGAGLAGLSSLSLAGGLALAGIVLGARLADRAVSGNAAGSAAPPTTRPA